MFKIIATAFLTAVATSFFWIWFYGTSRNRGRRWSAAAMW